MKKKILSVTLLTSLLIVALASAKETSAEKEAKKLQRMEEIINSLPDSVFENVKIEDLLDDEVYVKLMRDGWTSREIAVIMETAVKDKKKAKQHASYGAFAKEWRPTFGRTMSDDPYYKYDTPELTPLAVAGIIDAVGESNYNTSWEKVLYDPTTRKSGVRTPGYFKPVELKPSGGRTTWLIVNQNEPKGNQLYVIADGAGIFRTNDCGKNWDCITDNIPDRAYRGISAGSSLPVDPDDWNHIFAFMQSNTVYESLDGGDNWTRVEGGTQNNKEFKRGYAFRAKKLDNEEEGQLVLIGAAVNNSDRMKNELWLSYDKGVTWKQLTVKDALKDNVAISGQARSGFWFQQMAFDGKDRDIVYFPGCQSILYFDDAGRSGELKALTFDIYGKDKSELRQKQVTKFPFPGNAAGHMEIDPNNSDRMWYTVGNSTANYTALYYSDDRGKTWITLHEPHKGKLDGTSYIWEKDTYIGSGTVFGNETANVWLGGFGIEYDSKDTDRVPSNFFGCSMSSSYSIDGGHNWTEYTWTARERSYISEGLTNPSGQSNSPGYYYVSASRHNADNHSIASHKSGKVFRCSDGGLFLHDPEISGTVTGIGSADWVNIHGNMGAMLFYDVRVNEFGDQAIIGNTQDIDIQTYRYGRWGNWRGYEGSEASFNPYTSTGYFSSGGNAPAGMNPDSWHTARNYADVVTGDWYMLRTWNGNVTPSTLFRVEDVGRSLTDIYNSIGKTVTDVGLCRDKGRLTVFIRCNDNSFRMSTDTCKTFRTLTASNGAVAAFSNSKLAVDPDNSDIFYFGQNGGKVYMYDIAQGTWTAVGSGLPTNLTCHRLFFHEGSGDMYYIDNNTGIYILEKGQTQWRYWMKGYNVAHIRDCDINYTTQELVIADYGRGVWVADLQNPSDRYFDSYDKVGANPNRVLKIKEISHRDGIRVFGIDTRWTIPLYYDYHWKINGKDIDNPYQYLVVRDTDPVYTVQLALTLRESPDVKTVSSLLAVSTDSESTPIERRQGNALYSDGQGRVDIGYMDWFYGDFSVDFWLKPEGNGVILANSQKDVDKGAKGWVLYIDGGVLKFKYYPSNVLQQPTYELAMEQSKVISGRAVPMKAWSHIALTQERHGNINLYLNGELVASEKRIREKESHTLNNSVIMSLFGDAFESNTLAAAIDELKFWKTALSIDDVRREMFSTNLSGTPDLVAHYDFNAETLSDNTETFTGYRPKSRTLAVTSPQRMTVPVSADYVGTAHLKEGENALLSVNNNMPLVDIHAGADLNGIYTVAYAYKGNRWENSDDNLSEIYYTPSEYGYMIRTFGAVSPDATADIYFYNGNESFNAGISYRLYMADNANDRMYWKLYDGEVVYDNGKIKLPEAKLADIVDRKLLFVIMKPAIELTLDGLSSDGRVVVYDDEDEAPSFPFTARLIAGKQLKVNSYQIISDSTVVIVPSTPLSFNNKGEAYGEIKIDVEQLGDFNNVISTYIRGKNDEDMIPIPIDILNRISPRKLNNSVQIAGGGVKVGTAADFASLKGTKNLTIMGWVRIDSENMMEKGRNNDGVSPLLFFRTSPDNTGTTGIHLRKHTTANNVFDGAMLGYHWNDQSWNYNATTPFIIPKEDLGKWNHVALVVSPTGAKMYFNGMEYTMTGVPSNIIPECTVQSPLLIGMNVQGGNTYFNGAFDHVAVWDRSLTREEIHKYMHNRVLLNDPNLLAYVTMDETDSNGRIKDSLKGMTSTYYGTVTTGPATPVPFDPYRQDVDMNSPGCPITLSSTHDGCVASFKGNPYNYIAPGTEEQLYLPLGHEYYTIIFNSLPSGSSDITMTYSNEGLVDNDEIAVGIREIGSTKPFENYILTKSVQDHKAVFTVPASKLSKSSELMFFSTPKTSHRPNIVHMAFANGIQPGGIYLLGDEEDKINIDVNVVSGTEPVRIEAVESYVTLSTNEIKMDNPSQRVVITVNKEELRKTNPFGLSEVTVNLSGVEADALTLQVGLKPLVNLKLKNGSDDSHFTATKSVSTLDIEAELIEGYLAEPIELVLTPDNLNSTFDITNGTLLLNEPVTIGQLRHEPAVTGRIDEGWNLIGNPFLTDINITKEQNVNYVSENVTRFVYQALDGSNNIIAFDMTDYDSEQSINPFQAFYVQSMADNADITITDVAKERTLQRKTYNGYEAKQVRTMTLKLIDSEGNEVDRTTIRWDNAAHEAYELNEDAPKVDGVNSHLTNSIYTTSTDFTPLSINYTTDRSRALIPLVVDVAKPGDMTFEVSRLSGFESTEDKLYLVDFGPGDGSYERHLPLSEGLKFPFRIDEEGTNSWRFLIVPTFNGDLMVDAQDRLADSDSEHTYRIMTEKRSATVMDLRGDAMISIYSVSGALIVRTETTDTTFTTELDAGVYVVDIREDGKEYSTKIVVK